MNIMNTYIEGQLNELIVAHSLGDAERFKAGAAMMLASLRDEKKNTLIQMERCEKCSYIAEYGKMFEHLAMGCDAHRLKENAHERMVELALEYYESFTHKKKVKA